MRKQFAAALALPLALCLASSARAASEFSAELQEADRLAWLTNWYDALPIYAEVERVATEAGNRRDALYAKCGCLRGQMQTLPLPDISEQIAPDLESPIGKQDGRLSRAPPRAACGMERPLLLKLKWVTAHPIRSDRD